ncbi:MAG TPA: hypothetical protein PLV92_26645, partial [Pirellulaceae bacterium]|nr:hypothetical protein [Pirellulaceae bacterium]
MKRSHTWRRFALGPLLAAGCYETSLSIAASLSIAMIAAADAVHDGAADAAYDEAADVAAEVAAEDSSRLVGWAAHGESTTGGAGGPEYRVSDAVELARRLKSDEPKIVRVDGVVRMNGSVRVGSRTTLIGTRGAALVGGGLQIRKARNVIVRNLAISEATDAIDIEDSQHVWIDHCDLSRCKDGLLDIKRGADFITVSWNRFHDHHKTCLLGHSDKESIRKLDAGHLRTTYHHNFFDGTKTRHPRVRFA